MEPYIRKLYNYVKKQNIEPILIDDGFSFDYNGKNYKIIWDEDSICGIIIENDDENSSHEVDIYDLEGILEEDEGILEEDEEEKDDEDKDDEEEEFDRDFGQFGYKPFKSHIDNFNKFRRKL